ncbi:MAG TPA: tetratricopeptide repeat protein [Terriglobia bacterium]|nr:tetratricopeptide repeat protein [Terriglobia bacterium]
MMKVPHNLSKFTTADENGRGSHGERIGGTSRREPWAFSLTTKSPRLPEKTVGVATKTRIFVKGFPTFLVLLSAWMILPNETQSNEQDSTLASQFPAGPLSSPSSSTKAEANPAAIVKYRLAESLLEQGKAADAAEALKAAIQLQPNFTEAHFALGVIWARMGKEKYGAAIDQFLEVLRLDPKHVDARINLSNLLEQGGDFEAAAGILKEALATIDERADLYVMLGRKQEQAEKYTDAIQSFHRALILDPQTPYAHYGLGMTLRSQGDLAAARTEFELALKQNPDDAIAHFQLGRLLMYRNETSEAVHHFEESVRLKPDLAEAYSRLGLLYKSLKRNDEAEKAFRTAIQLNPRLEKACYGLAQLLQAKGEREEAARFFEQVKQLKERSDALTEASTLNVAGVGLMNAGKLSDALQKFQAALALDPLNAAAAYNQGLALARLGKALEAIESFKTAIRLHPGFALAEYGLGLALQLAGDPSADTQIRKAALMKQTAPQLGTMIKTARPGDSD